MAPSRTGRSDPGAPERPRDRRDRRPGAARARPRAERATSSPRREIQRLIDDMIETMRAADGAGLAANQVGETVRIAVIEVDHNPRYPYKPPIPLTVFVNPVIEPLDDELVERSTRAASRSRTCAATLSRHVQRPGPLPRPRRRRARRGQARPHRRHLPARGRPPRRDALPRPRRRPAHVHDLGAVRALPPRRLRRADHRVRRAGRVVSATYWCELAWLGGEARGARRRGRGRRRADRVASSAAGRSARRRRAARRADAPRPRQRPLARLPPRAARPRRRPGAASFWTWREQMYELAAAPRPRHLPARSPGRRSPRWRSPGSRRSASSTTSTTTPAASRTRTRTRSARR